MANTPKTIVDVVGAVKDYVDSKADTALSTTSTNPVQNKVITGAINDVSQAAGDAAEELIRNTTGWVGKNMVDVAVTGSGTAGGAPYTVNADKSITFNGSVTSSGYFLLSNVTNEAYYNAHYKGKECIISGSPAGFSSQLYLEDSTGQIVSCPPGGEAKFTFGDFHSKMSMYIRVISGETFNNVTFYPMVRPASDPDSTYEPYREAGSIVLSKDTRFIRFGIDSNGNYGYIKDGADTVTPFRNPTGNAGPGDVLLGKTFSSASYPSGATGTMLKEFLEAYFTSGGWGNTTIIQNDTFAETMYGYGDVLSVTVDNTVESAINAYSRYLVMAPIIYETYNGVKSCITFCSNGTALTSYSGVTILTNSDQSYYISDIIYAKRTGNDNVSFTFTYTNNTRYTRYNVRLQILIIATTL